MKIEVSFWGVARRLAGRERCELMLRDGASVDALIDALIEALDGNAELAAELDRCAFAVGTQLIARTHVLSEGDEVAVLPPVSGG